MDKIMFKSLQLGNWRQFNNIDLEFHPRLTVITGENGTGKTSILNILNYFINGGNTTYLASPTNKMNKQGQPLFDPCVTNLDDNDVYINHYVIGKIAIIINTKINTKISDNLEILVPKLSVLNNISYNVLFSKGKNPHNNEPTPISNGSLIGIFFPSKREHFIYHNVNSINLNQFNRQTAFSKYWQQFYNNNSNSTATQNIKSTLISLATLGYDSMYVKGNEYSRKKFEQVQTLLYHILPKSIGFEKLLIEPPEVVIQTKSGRFLLDAVSGGIASIIGIAWAIFLCVENPFDEEFVVIFDEPENHLHPKMQRELLPMLLDIFKNAQFVVSTHSPLIVSSVEDSNTYLFKFNDNYTVDSIDLSDMNKASSASQILMDALDTEFTMPIWVENKLKNVINNYSNQTINNQMLSNLRKEMESIGLEDYIPTTIVNILDNNNETT